VSRVVIVGVGALGSHLVQFLRAEDAQLFVIDMDRVEQKNTLSQFHARNSVGKNKVQALQQAMKFLWNTKVDGTPHQLTSDNVEQVLKGADLIIDCLDNAEARGLVQTYARAHDVPCLHGALSAGGELGRVVWDEQFTIDSEDGVGAATCEDGEHLPFIGMAATYLARSAQEFLKSGRKLGWQVYSLSPATKI
jgi:glyceraldehyde-3-phosphate dehydrogenase/erythrose-4-phosphate dehydrogenase